MKSIIIKLVRMGAGIQTIVLPDNNLASLKGIISVKKDSCFYRDGEMLNNDSILRDNDTIVYTFFVRGEAIVRRNGVKWEIHKNDPDRQISDFHAHNYDDNEVLDLYTGFLYTSHTKIKKAMMHKNDHEAILVDLSKRQEEAFSRKAEQVLRDKFNYK